MAFRFRSQFEIGSVSEEHRFNNEFNDMMETMNSTFNSKEEMAARLAEVQKAVAALEMKQPRTADEDKQYQELSMELTSLDTTLKAMDGKTM